MTNRDKINSMDNKRLANFIYVLSSSIKNCENCIWTEDCISEYDCKETIERWLGSEINMNIYKSVITRENYRIIEEIDENTVRALNLKDGYVYTIPKEDLIEIDNKE